jgi:beta-lactamase regulating signal transducer with metallopeptidase domain
MQPHIRDTDFSSIDASKQTIKITREIPLVWILGVLGLGAAQAVAMFFGVRDLSRTQSEQVVRQAEMGAEVKAINDKLNHAAVIDAKVESEVRFKLDDMSRRISAVEAADVRRTTKGQP